MSRPEDRGGSRRGAGGTDRHTGRVEPGTAPARSDTPDGVHEALTGFECSTRGRAGVRGLSATRLAGHLSDRDAAVLESLSTLRLATSDHLERLHFREGSPATQGRRCRKVMARLVDQRLVVRLERRIGGVRAGSAGFVYRLAPKGRQVLELLADGQPGPVRRRPEPSRHLADHTLASTEIYARLVEATRAGHLELIRYEPEPTCWRTYLGGGGQRIVLRPDGLVVTAEPGGQTEHWWFLEVDLGTEAPVTIRGKVAAYLTYATTGQEQGAHGVFPRVAFLTTSAHRATALARAVHAVPGGDQLCEVGLLNQATVLLGPPQQRNQPHLKGGES